MEDEKQANVVRRNCSPMTLCAFAVFVLLTANCSCGVLAHTTTAPAAVEAER